MIAHGPKRREQTLYQLLKHVFTRAKRGFIYAPLNAPNRQAKELPRHNFPIIECAFASAAEKHFIKNIEKNVFTEQQLTRNIAIDRVAGNS